ncbi:Alginate O-acetyltransferase AlgI/D-alanyl transfer protein DltB [Syntrophomonas zehnderi OL-4]|uniref:Alginate O-acetyltransferase AlgI/D-alanyl transfer protein DltB n=1 Tax=Syntrophomonas zehnderi OL-4 TaxID=690567 RepID=A0A0E4GEB6_9FIRM|nr:MBOAT family O-acyltransferase [Syntrophomonas zehnderi]CFX83697.1 Alginate O-acetyltransferase AlgI/D-alanyl transfer protein DltB [Syntrophomonas zehnderi OL-4]
MMFFQTPEFFFCLFVVLAIYYLLPRGRMVLLAAVSLAFYALAGLGPAALFVGITIANYFLGKALLGPHKKRFLWAGIILNVANLVFFKYTLFFLSIAEKVFNIALLPKIPFVADLVLPVGISFYTFQFISYLVDVYQQKIPPSQNLLVFWVFGSFFPHVVSGPIMRGGELIPQLEQIQTLEIRQNIRLGLGYLAMGLFKKLLIADYIAVYANNFFAGSASLGTVETWIAAYLYTFQLYFDFSAYSEMAVGIAYLFGIKLNLNFKTPYLSANATEFWRRWHITLSTWIRDYIYIPLGGSRQGELRKYLNLFLAMSISGLWHGAAFTFVIWGMYHGLLLIGHNIYRKFKARLGLKRFFNSAAYRFLSIFIFFHLTCIGWVFFRASSLQQAWQMVHRMVIPYQLNFSAYTGKFLLLIAGLYLLHIVENWVREHAAQIGGAWERLFPPPLRALAYTAFILVLIIFSQGQTSDFIYFKF